MTSRRDSGVALFEARRLHKRFGRQVVLEEVTLAFEAGRLSGIMGPNGAGKTTCFNVLTGRFKPDRGRVVFDGTDITGLPPRAIADRGVARSFQAMTLFDDFSTLLNVVMALPDVRGRTFDMVGDLMRGEHAAEGHDVLTRVGLRDLASVPAGRLSYGDRRRLDIAIALAQRPRILFLDEPTAGLGADAVARLADLLRELKRSVTIVLIEHNMAFLFGLADHVSVMHWGQVIAEGTPAALREDRWVRASNLGSLV
jgi:branched-chain amino acid transport system ATP-binding protein